MSVDDGTRIEVQRLIPADAAAIFAVVSDPKGHVAIDGSGSLMSSTGEPVTAVGDTFVMHMDRAAINDIPDMGKYDVTVEITAFEKDREISWEVSSNGRGSFGHYYGYHLEPADGGTMVTSYYDWSAISDAAKASGRFPIIPESALRSTLGILSRTVAP